MTKVSSLPYEVLISALQRDGWKVFRQRGSHIRVLNVTEYGTKKLPVPQL